MNYNNIKKAYTSLATLLLLGTGIAVADTMQKEVFEERIPIPTTEVPPPVAPGASCEGMSYGVSAGLPTWFFDKEDTRSAPGLYFDGRHNCHPFNVRVGVEGRHLDLGQDAAASSAEWPGRTTEITMVRIPFAFEYAHDVNEKLMWFAGGGPDIVHVANDVSDTAVGFHLSTRVDYELADNFTVGVEAGYMWAEVDGTDNDIELDTAFVTPTIGFRF